MGSATLMDYRPPNLKITAGQAMISDLFIGTTVMPVTVKVGGKLSSVLTAIHKTFIKFWFFKNKLPKWEFVTEKQITNDTHTPREFFPLGIVGHYLFFSVPHC